ncbi:hypothetical protein NQ317_009163 [Molorchus minor]|uniref:C2H2-type domain-containing protein n=1 Tax=Molorchus minor TaxID=1323400 RepID=A0ABQ9K0S4_9CUCU|nr:hypothetical protein NQ317_009163 [Molorchus minor]
MDGIQGTETEKSVCAICLKKSTNFDILSDTIREMLDILHLNLHRNANNAAIICHSCIAKALELFEFKSTCLYTEDNLFPYFDSEIDSLDMKQTYIKIKQKETLSHVLLPSNSVICRLCLKMVNKENVISLHNSNKKANLVKTILQKFFTQLNMKMIRHPVVCMSCQKSLQSYYYFVREHLPTDKKKKNRSNYVGDLQNSIIVKRKRHNLNRSAKRASLQTDLLTVGQGGIDQYNEKNHSKGSDLQNSENDTVSSQTLSKPQRSNDNQVTIKEEDIDQEADSTADEMDEELDEECNSPQATSTLNRVYECQFCLYGSDSIQNFKIHIKNHKGITQITSFACDFCLYKTKEKSRFRQHINSHKEGSIYKCHCGYKNKHKASFSRHAQLHRNPEEREKFECDKCPYWAFRKDSLKDHIKSHIPAIGKKKFKCAQCPAEYVSERGLRRHSVVHQNPDEIALFKCSKCLYTTNRNDSLIRHMLRHKKSSETHQFKCVKCSYKAMYKSSLKTHMLTHKSPSQLKMFKCDLCSFESKLKGGLRSHMITHKEESEVKMFRCDICDFQTKFKNSLELHMRSHMQVELKKCQFCRFESKWDIKRHLRRHHRKELLMHGESLNGEGVADK